MHAFNAQTLLLSLVALVPLAKATAVDDPALFEVVPGAACVRS